MGATKPITRESLYSDSPLLQFLSSQWDRWTLVRVPVSNFKGLFRMERTHG